MVSVENAAGRDVCSMHVWTDDDGWRGIENRLLPGATLLASNSPFRLHDGSRRDFVVPPQGAVHVEAIDCQGEVIDARVVRAQPGMDVSLTVAAR